MQEFDIIVIGAGSGLNVSSAATSKGMKVAIIEPGPMGGTCLNRGCIPSKMLIHPADVVQAINTTSKFGIKAKYEGIDFEKLVTRVNEEVGSEAKQIEEGINATENMTLFKGEAKFVEDKIIEVNGEKITAEKIVIAAGTRPNLPAVEGLESVNYMTSKEALQLKEQPETLTIIGGGYIGCELGHFYGATGTKVTIVEFGSKLVPREDQEIVDYFSEEFSKKHQVYFNHAAVKVEKRGDKIITTIKNNDSGETKEIESDELLVAAGLKSNSDKLGLENTNIKMDKRGYVEANEYMETSVDGIWALGDIVGKYLFKHSANRESMIVARNAIYGQKEKINYTAMPHAIFSSPQIAGVGETKQELNKRQANYAEGKYFYKNTGMGMALMEDGFIKVYADKETQKILGCHIVGPEASTLIQEIILAMRVGLTVPQITDQIYIHPALPEVVQRGLNSIKW